MRASRSVIRSLVCVLGVFVLLASFVGWIEPIYRSSDAYAEDGSDVENTANAEEQTLQISGLGIRPATNRVKLDPGQEHKDVMVVKNESSKAEKFRVYAAPYQASNEEYEPDFSTANDHTKIADWIKFEKTEYNIDAGAEQEVPYLIKVPQDASGGGQYAVIFAETVVDNIDTKGEGQTINVSKRPGLLIFATINGEFEVKGSIESQTIKGLLFKPPVSTEAIIKNDGGTDFIAKTSISVRPFFGGKGVYSSSRNYEVLPETTRKIEMDWSSTPQLGLFIVESAVSVAELDISESVSRVVFVCPMPLFVLIIIAFILLIVMIVARVRKSRELKKSRQED